MVHVALFVFTHLWASFCETWYVYAYYEIHRVALFGMTLTFIQGHRGFSKPKRL